MKSVNIDDFTLEDANHYIKTIANTFTYRTKLLGMNISTRKIQLMTAVFLKKYISGNIYRYVDERYLTIKIPVLIKECIQYAKHKGFELNVYASNQHYTSKNFLTCHFDWSLLSEKWNSIVDEIIDLYANKNYILTILEYKKLKKVAFIY